MALSPVSECFATARPPLRLATQHKKAAPPLLTVAHWLSTGLPDVEAMLVPLSVGEELAVAAFVLLVVEADALLPVEVPVANGHMTAALATFLAPAGIGP